MLRLLLMLFFLSSFVTGAVIYIYSDSNVAECYSIQTERYERVFEPNTNANRDCRTRWSNWKTSGMFMFSLSFIFLILFAAGGSRPAYLR